ncbi:MAG: bifunctional transaldolase/phosoglucose isomerase [Actinobacteria bacterium]|nr:bifunctional transaldolase/phosoglucose isomerase [Actinomycetota bacterium]
MATSTSLRAGPIGEIVALGQSVWFDNIRRGLLSSGEFERMVREDGLSGVTSNPSIFEKAIVGSSDYDETLSEERAISVVDGRVLDPKSVYEGLAIADLRQAADILRPVYEETDAGDGYVSMEVAPDLAHDTNGTVAEAQRLWATVDRPNLMIKVPATEEGIPAIRQLIRGGINVNITLLFSTAVYEQVVAAYLAGLEDRLADGGKLAHVASVASFFISRIDSAIDPRVSARLQGKVGIASAKLAYASFAELFDGERWQALEAGGAQAQRLLWASTSTKNPAYSDVLYVESLIGPETVDTIYPATYEAFKDHGKARPTLGEGLPEALALLEELAKEGVDLEEVTGGLLREGVEKFIEAQGKLLASVEQSLRAPTEPHVSTFARSLPAELGLRVDATIEAWRAGGKVARLWGRDEQLWTDAGEAGWLGWLTVPLDQQAHPHRFRVLVDDIRASGFEQALLLGMGGSSLCPEVLALTFPPKAGLPRLRILDSTDPQQIKSAEDELDLTKTLFFVSSKSGTTLEPNIFAAYFHARLTDLVGAEEAGRRFIAITDPGTPLETLANEVGYRHVFHGWPSIGGRYSALSDFGMIPGAAAGVDVVELLDRAERMAHACAACVPATDNPGLQLGAIIGSCATSGRDKLTLISSPGIRDLGAWLEQLLAESTGKHGKGIVPVDREPLGDPGVYGDDRLFVYLRLASDEDAGQDAKLTALEEAGQPVVRIVLDDVYDLGGEFFRWEFATAVAGSIIGIDPFDQPDVEDAKIAARELTDAYDESGSLPELKPFYEGEGFRLIADERDASVLHADVGSKRGLEEYLAAHLSRVVPGDYVALLAYLPMTTENERLLTEIRVLVRDHLRVATCVGFGPRFQHSTGQAYKGGPNSGVLLQITCADTVELPVPGHAYTFGVVKEAQARGDFDVLAKRGRRALRIDVGADPSAGLAALRNSIGQVLHSITGTRAGKRR